MFDYFKDGVNPRGPESGATARAARQARRSADAAEDMLELEMSTDRNATAQRIVARRNREAGRRAFWHRLDNLLALAFVAAVAWLMLTPASNAPQSAVTNDTPANVSKVPDDAGAPVRQAQAPDVYGSADNSDPRVKSIADTFFRTGAITRADIAYLQQSHDIAYFCDNANNSRASQIVTTQIGCTGGE